MQHDVNDANTAKVPPNLHGIFFNFVSRQHTGLIALYCVLFMAFPIQQILMPRYFGLIIEDLSTASVTGASLFERIKVLLVIILFLLALKQAMFVGLDYMEIHMIPRLEAYYREKVVHAVLENFEDDYREIEVGELISKIVKLPQVVRDIFHQAKNYVIPGLIVTVLMPFFYVTLIDKRVALVSGLSMVLFYVVVFLLARRCVDKSQKRDRLNNRMHEEIDETMGNLLSVYASDSVNREKKRLRGHQERYNVQYLRSGQCAIGFKANFSAMYFILFIVMNGFAVYLACQGQLSAGALVTTLMINSYVVDNIELLSTELRDMIYNWGVLAENQRFIDELFYLGEAQKRRNTSPSRSTVRQLQIPRGEVRFEQTTFQYAPEARALDSLNLLIEPGEHVAIMGDIGSGKSTLIKLILRLHSCTSGGVFIDGQDLAQCTTSAIRRKIGYVQQQPKLFNRTVYSNIVYGNDSKKWTREAVEQRIVSFGVAPLFEGLPKGLDTVVGKGGSKVSGGQRQAISLLRMACGGRKIFLLDEPTSALDKKNKTFVLEMLEHITKGKTSIIVTHDDEILPYVDRVLRFEKGRLLSEQKTRKPAV
jgi:ATP-binding cassette subfamily B multidrug efflux pump